MKSKSLLLLFSFSVIAIFIIGFNSCKKVASEELLSQELSTSFTATNAKEWYYGVFKKTSEWKDYYKNINSKIATAGKTSSPSSVPKLPDWGHPSYRKSGNLEIVEFPLVKSYNNILVPSAGLSANDQKRIAEASLTRIVFIKNGNTIDVREVDYIPEMGSLIKMNFDISGNTVNKLDKNFSGRLVIKKWDGAEVGRRLVVDGKIIKSGILKKASQKNGTNVNFNSAGSKMECTTIRITEYERFCIPVLNGDNVQTGEICTDWMPTGFFWDEEYCYEVPDGDDCMFYGTCDTPPGDENPPLCDATAEYPEVQQFTDYIAYTESSSNYEADVTGPNPDPITGVLSVDVVEATIANWRIKADIKYGYYHDWAFDGSRYNDFYDLYEYTCGNGYFVGSNNVVKTTYTTTTPTTNAVIKNNTPNCYGLSRIVGTIKQKLSIPIRIPFCSPLELERTDNINRPVYFRPK